MQRGAPGWLQDNKINAGRQPCIQRTLRARRHVLQHRHPASPASRCRRCPRGCPATAVGRGNARRGAPSVPAPGRAARCRSDCSSCAEPVRPRLHASSRKASAWPGLCASARSRARWANGGRPAPRLSLRACSAKAEVALLGELDQQRVVGQVTLDDHLARLLGAAGAAGHLHGELGHALAGAEVGGEQAAIGIEDRHQGHTREMVTLGEHLGADQDARLALAGWWRTACPWRPCARCCRGRRAAPGNRGKSSGQALFGAFGAGAHRAQVDLAAFRAVARRALDVAAVVAAQLAVALVQGHARVAARALG